MKLFTVAITTTLLLGAHGAGAWTQYNTKEVTTLELNTTGCHFFQISGVNQADPVVPNSPWFAIPIAAGNNAKEMLAVVLTARATGTPLSRVVATGNIACGAAEVGTIDL
jgi:hypothetical protein